MTVRESEVEVPTIEEEEDEPPPKIDRSKLANVDKPADDPVRSAIPPGL